MFRTMMALAWSGAVFALGFAAGWIVRSRLSRRRRKMRGLICDERQQKFQTETLPESWRALCPYVLFVCAVRIGLVPVWVA